MEHLRELFRKFQNSDGRVKIGTLSGVTVVALIAMLVGIIPAFATDGNTPTGIEGVHPTVVNYGGGSGACSAVIEGYLPSAASKEFHINNPMPGVHGPNADGITVEVFPSSDPKGTVFTFTLPAGSPFVVYDVVVNGGRQNNLYDYDGNGKYTVRTDTRLHAPLANNKKSYHNLSHINVCYDVPGKMLFQCNTPIELKDPGKIFEIAEATIYKVEDASGNQLPCLKSGRFFIENSGVPAVDGVTLDFGNGTNTVTGRLEITKQFTSLPFVDLQYDGGTTTDVPWCGTDTVTNQTDFPELSSTEYPTIPSGHKACKVFEGEHANKKQENVIFFKFMDPRFY